jgi:hypothetical protein
MQTPPRQQISSQQIAPNAPARNPNQNIIANYNNVINNIAHNDRIDNRFNFTNNHPSELIDNSQSANINHRFNFRDNNTVNRQLNFNNIQ